jgi:hypothetical protein
MVETLPTSNGGGEYQHLITVEAVPTSDVMEAVPTSNGGGEYQHLIMMETVPTNDDGGHSTKI